MPVIAESNKRIAKNTLFLYCRMLLLMVVHLYTARVVLAALGIDDYGIYNVVGGIVVLFSFINGALSSATQRFINFELGRSDIDTVRNVFSVSMNVHLCVAIVVLILSETIGLWFLNTQMNIAPERMDAARWVFHFSIIATFIRFIQVPYNASVIACEKMSFFVWIGILEAVLLLFNAFLVDKITTDKLKLYSVLVCGVSAAVFICYKWFCRAKVEFARYRMIWDKKLFGRLMSFSGWMLLGSAATVGSTQGVNIVLNIFNGVAVNAAMGICNQVNNAVNQFVTNFQTAFSPQIVKLYASGEKAQLQRLINRASRFSFLLLFALALPLIANMDLILNLWLEEVPQYAAAFCSLILIASLVDSASKPVGLAIHATGRVKYYNITMSLALSLNVISAYFMLKSGISPVSVLLVNIAVTTICFGIRLYLAQRYDAISVLCFFRDSAWRFITAAIISAPLPLYLSQSLIGWNRLIITCLSFFVIYVPATVFIGLTAHERKSISSNIKAKLHHA